MASGPAEEGAGASRAARLRRLRIAQPRSLQSRQLWAASLGMIPIAREVFWGPMAYAMIGGIIIATLLTLLFLPALYVAWYKIREPKKENA